MTLWYAPDNMRAWRRRLAAPRIAFLMIALAVLIVTEWRLDWMETGVGGYLVATNSYRPKSGTIWDQGRQTESARQALAEAANQRQDLQNEIRQAVTLGQVVADIGDQKGAMLSADHFVELYLKLPPVISHEIVSPYALLNYLSNGQWQRTFIERQEQQLSIYLLDVQSQVIHRLNIGPVLLGYIERGEVAIGSGLEQLSDFSGHIYPADRFFAALDSLPEEVRKRIISHPEELLSLRGRIRRIGISQSAIGDAVELGVEVEGLDGSKVILIQGVADDVRTLQQELEGGGSVSWPWSRGGRP